VRSQSLHLIKEICAVQRRIIAKEKEAYAVHSEIKTLMETTNHLIDELIMQVQIDCNEEDLNNEIKETLITGGA
jgi:hypothetical protein